MLKIARQKSCSTWVRPVFPAARGHRAQGRRGCRRLHPPRPWPSRPSLAVAWPCPGWRSPRLLRPLPRRLAGGCHATERHHHACERCRCCSCRCRWRPRILPPVSLSWPALRLSGVAAATSRATHRGYRCSLRPAR